MSSDAISGATPEHRVPLGILDLTVRRVRATSLTEEQEGQLLGLLERAFNGGPSWFRLPVPRLDHWRWKVRDFPGPSWVYLLELADRIVYMDLEQYRGYLVRGARHWVRGGGDIALDPEFQGRGVSSVLSRFRTAHRDPINDLSFGFQSHPVELGRMNRPDAMQAFANPLEMLHTVLDPALASRMAPPPDEAGELRSRTKAVIEGRTRPRRGPSALRATMLAARRAAWRLRYPPYRRPRRVAWRIAGLDRFDERSDAFFAQALRQFDFVQEHSTEWLNWRLCDPRAGPFTIRAAEEGDRIVGYAAFRVLDGQAAIVDLLALPGRTDVVRSLVEDALAHARDGGAASVTCWWMRRHPYSTVLRRCGFIPRYPGGVLSYHANRIGPEALRFFEQPDASVHFTFQDQDHV